MTVLVRDLLSLHSFQNAKLVTGQTGIHNEVDNIMIMEAPDIENWVTPNELLLTSLYGFSNYSEAELESFIAKIHHFECAGLIVKTDRFVSQIPKAIMDSCTKYHLPLFQIERDIKYNDIMVEVMQLLFNETNMLLQQYRLINQKFISLAMNGTSYKEILVLLEKLINNPVYLYKQLHTSAKPILSGDEDSEDVMILSDLSSVEKKEHTSYHYKERNFRYKNNDPQVYREIVVPIPQIKEENLYLAIREAGKAVVAIDYMAIENAISFIQMEYLKQASIREMKYGYSNDLIDDLISGKVDSKAQLEMILNQFRMDIGGRYRFLTVESKNINNQLTTDFNKSDKHTNNLIAAFKKVWPDIVYRIRPYRINFILNTKNETIITLKKKLQQLIDQTKSQHSYLQIGISEEGTVDLFPKHSQQALETLQLAAKIYPQAFVISYGDLGFYRLLLKLPKDSNFLDFVPEELIQLQTHKNELYRTLVTYLDNNQNIKASAAALFIHPKTMSYRMNKIISMLQIDLTNADEVTQLNIGVRLLKVAEERLTD